MSTVKSTYLSSVYATITQNLNITGGITNSITSVSSSSYSMMSTDSILSVNTSTVAITINLLSALTNIGKK